MDAETLHRIVPSASLQRCADLIDGYHWCCRIIGANTVWRCAMLLAQVAEESASFHALEEYASGSEYEWRHDLGNTQPGDGVRFKGRTLIQITGRNNYGRVSQWAHSHGLVPTSDYFIQNPSALAHMRYAWVGPAQYWLGNHNHGYGSINAAADARDLVAATYMVNGAQNGYDTRRAYYRAALSQGNAILPAHPSPAAPKEDTLSAAEVAQINAHTDAKTKQVMEYLAWLFHEGDTNSTRQLSNQLWHYVGSPQTPFKPHPGGK